MLDLPAYLDRITAERLLNDVETDAFAALLSVACLLGDDFLDEDGQPMTDSELQELLGVPARQEVLVRVCGLLNAVAGDEFTTDPDHFRRMVSAIVEGDPFQYEDDGEEPTLPDVYWALYLVGLTVEDDIVSELGGRVLRYVAQLAEEEAEDSEDLAAEIKANGGADAEELESYINRVLILRRAKLVIDLQALKCKPEWMADLDPELSSTMSRLAAL
jgi:hypothetical protein